MASCGTFTCALSKSLHEQKWWEGWQVQTGPDCYCSNSLLCCHLRCHLTSFSCQCSLNNRWSPWEQEAGPTQLCPACLGRWKTICILFTDSPIIHWSKIQLTTCWPMLHCRTRKFLECVRACRRTHLTCDLNYLWVWTYVNKLIISCRNTCPAHILPLDNV